MVDWGRPWYTQTQAALLLHSVPLCSISNVLHGHMNNNMFAVYTHTHMWVYVYRYTVYTHTMGYAHAQWHTCTLSQYGVYTYRVACRKGMHMTLLSTLVYILQQGCMCMCLYMYMEISMHILATLPCTCTCTCTCRNVVARQVMCIPC